MTGLLLFGAFGFAAYWKFRNIDWRTVTIIAGPGALGAVLGAYGRLEPRKVVGSVASAEFAVSVAAGAGFLLSMGSQDGFPWSIAGALLVGGVLAAPIAVWLVRRTPARVLGVVLTIRSVRRAKALAAQDFPPRRYPRNAKHSRSE